MPSSPGTEKDSEPPTFAVHTPEGEEEKPFFDDEVIVPLVELPPPPDGGWGWVICFSSFMCNLILDGIAYTFGVLLKPLVMHFDSNASTVSWVGSLLAGVYLTSGPIVGGLVNKFGCRPVCIAGSIVAFVGLVLSVFSPNVPVLMLTYGVIGGFGLGLIYLPAVVAVGYYFERRRALATGISVCGSGVGTFVFAPLATFLLEQYGWKGANLVFAALCLNCAVFGALMRPLELTARVDKERSDSPSQEASSKFTVQLPDGTHHAPGAASGDSMLTPSQGFHPNYEIGSVISPSINIPQLPTIAEQTVTAEATDEHRPLADIFPAKSIAADDESEQESTTEAVAALAVRPVRGSHRKQRTVSECVPMTSTGGKFHVTPVRPMTHLRPAGSSTGIPRNSSAPHFVDPSLVLPRISSTPGFGRLARLQSQASDSMTSVGQDTLIFGLQGSLVSSNTTLHLQPAQSGSRRGSRPIVRPLYRKDVFYAGSVAHIVNAAEQQKLPDVPSFANLDEYRHSVISIPKMSRRQSVAMSIHRSSIMASHLSIPPSVRKASIAETGEIIESEGTKPIVRILKEMLNVTLLKNPLFMLVGLSNFASMMGFYVPFVYLPNMAVLNANLEIEDANFLISIIGISNTVGRVAAGWMSDFECVNSLVVSNVSLFLSGVCVMVLPFCADYYTYVVLALLFGLFVAAYISLTSIVLVDLLGLDNLTSAFGLLVLFRGVSSMVGPPLAGMVYEATESYDASFYTAGGFLILAAVISVFADVLSRIQSRHSGAAAVTESVGK